MSTVTHLEQFRRTFGTDRPTQPFPKNDLRLLWADSLATMSIVTLVSIFVYEAMRIVLN
jgi:hypothetical protein